MPKFNYNKLKGKIIERYGSQSNFIKCITMSEPTFIKKIKNGYFTQEEIYEIVEVLHLSLSDIPTYFFTI